MNMYVRVRFIVVLVITLIAFGLSGCSTLNRYDEATWQGMNLIDTISTVDLMKDPCVREGHPLTRQIIGNKPSTGEIIAYGVASAGFHMFVSDRLLESGHMTAYKVWQGLTFINTGYAVGKNISIGWRAGPNKTGCPRSVSLGGGKEPLPGKYPSIPGSK